MSRKKRDRVLHGAAKKGVPLDEDLLALGKEMERIYAAVYGKNLPDLKSRELTLGGFIRFLGNLRSALEEQEEEGMAVGSRASAGPRAGR
jgi:hypothetical protein